MLKAVSILETVFLLPIGFIILHMTLIAKKTTLLFALLLSISALSQQPENCSILQSYSKLFGKSPQTHQKYLQFQDWVKTIEFNATQNLRRQTTAVQYTIPVVFHILHQNGAENIKDEQVLDALKILNNDFKKLNADTVNTVPSFKNIAADCQIEFRLATKDSLGNCINGIIHHYNALTNWIDDIDSYVYTWNPSRYLNIYIVSSINTNAAAYTFLPGTVPPQMDVVVIRHTYLGSIGTGSPQTSRVLTHEIGHWFGLNHIWGGGSPIGLQCGDDGIPDTPVTKGQRQCDLTAQVCNPGVIENVQNFMNYTYCANMFTSNQRTLMHNVLNSTNLSRKTLYTSANLVFTGVTNPALCAPNTDFYSEENKYFVCAGKTLNFSDFSTNGTPNTYSWSCTGSATLSAPTGSTTGIYFPVPGMYTVTLITQNTIGSGSATKTIVALTDAAHYANSHQESFENSFLPAFWQITNPDAGTSWAPYLTSASHGAKSYFIDGNSNPPGQEDFLQTGNFNLQANPTASLFVDVSYARKSTTHNDLFKIQATTNCGATWLDIYSPGMGNLANQTGGTFAGAFVPAPGQWLTIGLHNYPNFNSLLGQPAVAFRFYFKEDQTAGFGNRLFIDNINFVTSPVGVFENKQLMDYQIYPNPGTGIFNINFALSSEAKVSLKVFDLNGGLLFTEKEMLKGPGAQQLKLSLANLDPGIYLLEFNCDGTRTTKKLIIQ